MGEDAEVTQKSFDSRSFIKQNLFFFTELRNKNFLFESLSLSLQIFADDNEVVLLYLSKSATKFILNQTCFDEN